ncbi:fungal hydrophobin-domain-containing protein [Crepidotus variabilis]|uniref:Hydrophobin n=1 Tax=Crepidotus variabilis TaxID=179855 RepID=A0A9P6JI48_9AGAR|nr:fungal hydrophobin-domain-containing protein [Crepidotus variabilis]
MQFTLLIASIFATVSLAAAWATTTVTVTTYPPQQTPPPASQCNTGELYCCNNLEAANTDAISGILAALLVEVQPVTAIIGTSCSPIDVLSIGSGGNCAAQPVCCQNNHYEGLVVIGCSPVNINL